MKVVSGIVFLFALVAGLAALSAWPVMLLWGAIASTYGLPTMGFGTAVQVSVLASILQNHGGSKTSGSSSK